ncbi:MAG: hypothetical protein ACFFC7_10690 [Candidatus Hermodarchaeota archaeon]
MRSNLFTASSTDIIGDPQAGQKDLEGPTGESQRKQLETGRSLLNTSIKFSDTECFILDSFGETGCFICAIERINSSDFERRDERPGVLIVLTVAICLERQ